MKSRILTTVLLVLLGLTAWFYLSDGAPEQNGNRETAVIDGVNFVGMTVSDLDRSVEVYSQAAELSRVSEKQLLMNNSVIDRLSGRANTQATTQLMKSVNSQLMFMQFVDTPQTEGYSAVPVNGPGIAHVCFQVNAETNSYQNFLSSGATTIGDSEMVTLNPKNPVAYAYIHDHDGIMLEVEHVDVAALSLPEPPKNQYRIRHVSLATSDMDRLVGFYSILLEEGKPRRAGRFFGFSSEKIDRVSGLADSKIKMSWFQVRNLELEIIEYLNPRPDAVGEPRHLDALGYNMIVFDVKDLEQARTLFTKAGGKIINDVDATFGGDTNIGEGTIFGRDPDGNLIGLQKIAASNKHSSKNFLSNGI